MNGRPLTDAQISGALRAHLPERAAAGLRERVSEAAETTTQQRALPSFLGALSDADPVARWRSLLIAAALLVALAFASAAAVGALHLLDRDPLRDLSLEPRPSQQGVVAPSSTPSGPTARPTASPVTSPAGVWIATGTMGTPRAEHAAVRLLDGRVLVVGCCRGGGGSSLHDLTSAELYDPANGTWSPTGSMAKGLRANIQGTAVLLRDGKVLVQVALGEDPPGAEVYDPASGTWAATGQMVRGADFVGDTAVALQDGRVLVAGLNGAQLYDPVSGTWSATGKMTIARYYAAATLLSDGRVLVAGGDVPPDRVVDSAELYDPDTGSWTAITSMHAAREPIAAFLQPDGKVLVVGSESVEVYDPVTGVWTTTAAMATPDLFLYGSSSTTLLSDGRLLLAASGDQRSAALYDPGTGTWATAAPMLRSHGTPAIQLLDGTVLVAGGRDCLDGVCVSTGSAELYVPAGVAPPSLPAFPSPPPPVIPTPTPIPSPYPPAVGPVPPGARSWTVRVVNESSGPATLFLAEDGENGLGQLCGSVTPNVVPAGVTGQVTFMLPPRSESGCWIWVNPVPGQGGSLFETSDAPLAGEIFIQQGGQGGWLSP